MALPEGTVTFLRTDLEGSMSLLRAVGPAYDELNLRHLDIVRQSVEAHGGQVVRTEGDAVFAVFTDASAGARAAVDIQRGMSAATWPSEHAFRTRIGLHSGAAHRVGEDYGGFEVNRAARIAAAGWGGQIVLSDPARALISDDESGGWDILHLGAHRLKDLPEPEQLFQLLADGLPRDFPPLRSGLGPADRLPQRVAAIIGRDDELRTLDGLIAGSRLLTLTGPGGTGKTTLAVELARRHADGFGDGARFVDLQAIREPDLVRAEVARGVDLLDGPLGTAAQRLPAYMATQELLIVIDNFEQVLEAAGVVGELLAVSPGSRVIVTSRVPLRLRAEQEYAVRPMRVGDGDDEAGSDAVRLFIDRARRVRPDLSPSDDDLDVVAEICRRLDGLPLAIELCAARAGGLPLSAIRDRLREHRPLPGSGPRDLPDRQRTMDDTVAWSFGLLEPPLQRLFVRLAVFEESFDHVQADAVCGPPAELGVDPLDGVVRLGEQSLLTRVEDAVGGIRFGWLETIRHDALRRLEASGEGDAIRARHARAFADLATAASEHIPGADQARWLDRLGADEANLRAATLHAIAIGDVETALHLVSGLWRYWLQSGRLSEGKELVQRALALPGADAPTPLRVRALDAAGGLAYWEGDVVVAHAVYEDQLVLARRIDDRPGEGLALLNVYFTRQMVGDVDAALAARSAAEAIYRELGDAFGVARLEQADLLFLLARAVGDPADGHPADGHPADGDPAMHMAELEARASAAEALPDPWLSRVAPAVRAFACLRQGDLAGAMLWLVRALRGDLAVRERTDAALALQFAVMAAQLLGRPELAATIHGAAQASFEQLGIRTPATYEELTGVDPIPTIRAALGQDPFDEAVARGRRLSLDEAVDLVEAATTS
jgi:predicted ATPase/class 3 adenylate cyclase